MARGASSYSTCCIAHGCRALVLSTLLGMVAAEVNAVDAFVFPGAVEASTTSSRLVEQQEIQPAEVEGNADEAEADSSAAIDPLAELESLLSEPVRVKRVPGRGHPARALPLRGGFATEVLIVVFGVQGG